MDTQRVWIAGQWSTSTGTKTFQAHNPRTRAPLPEVYPISDTDEMERAAQAASEAFEMMCGQEPERRADFLEQFASAIEAHADALVTKAHEETGLPIEPRLAKAELPRTTNQLRQAAAAVRDRSWTLSTIDKAANIRALFGPLGPVCVFGPNNFPFAFNSMAGGDFAAAIAAGNPVIAKANSSHPGVTRLFAEIADPVVEATGLPPGTIQLLYRLDHADGERLVSHPLVGATGYTGSRGAGLALKRAADAAGKPIYLELSSVNPVLILPGALLERAEEVANDFQTSCLMGTGQFCTNPGLILLLAGDETETFISNIARRFESAPVGTLLSPAVESSLTQGVKTVHAAGATLVTGGNVGAGTGCSFSNTLLRVSGEVFLANPHALQTEMFGNASLIVVADDLPQLCRVVEALEGNLTGAIYSDRNGEDDDAYPIVEPLLRRKVGRLLNDKMPTGVAVSSAMNHGGPYPATGHPGFTAVGVPAAIRRFAALHCYDGVRPNRLPPELRDANPQRYWRLVNGTWSRDDA